MTKYERVNDENKTIIDAINSVCWYNGYDDIVRSVISHIKDWDKEDVIVPLRGNISCIPDEYEEKLIEQLIWMLCVLMYGDYGTSPRGGWVENRDGAIKLLERFIEDRPNDDDD